MSNELIGDPTEKMDTTNIKDDEFETDVPGVKADGYIAQGTNKFPKFNVSQSEFYQNMELGRRRLRFASGSPTQEFMQNTKYRNPFYISYTDENGKTYTRKIK
jgi:hypothetical protein